MKAPQRPILLIDNDRDDHDLIRMALSEINCPYPMLSLYSAKDALEYLLTTSDQPFLLLCDIMLPIASGLELRKTIEDTPVLKRKAIPYIFLTDFPSRENIAEAYRLSVQGFFSKPHEFDRLKLLLQRLIGYWEDCLHPYDPDVNA